MPSSVTLVNPIPNPLSSSAVPLSAQSPIRTIYKPVPFANLCSAIDITCRVLLSTLALPAVIWTVFTPVAGSATNVTSGLSSHNGYGFLAPSGKPILKVLPFGVHNIAYLNEILLFSLLNGSRAAPTSTTGTLKELNTIFHSLL